MRKLRNVLYCLSEDVWLKKEGGNIVVEREGKEIGRSPLHLLGGIVAFNRSGMSPALMQACCEGDIAVSFLAPHGRFIGRLSGPQTGNVLLRRAQHQATSNLPQQLEVAGNMLRGKIANARQVLRRFIRDYGDQEVKKTAQVQQAIKHLGWSLDKIGGCDALADLRGLEGNAAKSYFAVLSCLIRSKTACFEFSSRNKRPALDPVNAVLNFLYTLLAHECRSALETVGLDPQMGFFHADRPGRPSLALDLMEEFRAPMADRVMLSLINRQQLKKKDFEFQEGGAVLIAETAKKTILGEWQSRKKEKLYHPFFEESVEFGLFPYLQAQLLARYLRADLDGYPPFIWK